MRSRVRPLSALLLAGLAAFAPRAAAADNTLDLRLGDPERRERHVPLVLDAISDARSGELLSPAGLAARLADARIVFVGESHTSVDFHRVQLRVIEELLAAGHPVAIGLEMFPYTAQEHLDRWGAGLLTERGFVELSEWYDNWGYHWNYYREIFLLARDRGVRLVALNTPRDVVKAVREKGIENLSEDEAAHMPPRIDTESDEHFALFRAFFDDADFHNTMNDEQWRSMFEAQCTWDAAMGFNAVKALEAAGDPRGKLVVLVGSGHVAYGLGIQRQAAQWFDGRMSTVLPIGVGGPCEPDGQPVRASYADFVWGVPYEEAPLYPSLGLSSVEHDESGRRRVVHVAENSPAEAAGLRVGDLLLTMADAPLLDRATLNRRMAEVRWGDRVPFGIRRDESEITLDVDFRRPPAEPCDETEAGE